MAERDPKELLLDRVRAADPTSLPSYKLLDMTFKILQWISFSSLIRAIGKKFSSFELQSLGWTMLTLALIFTFRVVCKMLFGFYGPNKFRTKSDRIFAYLYSVLALAMVIMFVERPFFLASEIFVSNYIK